MTKIISIGDVTIDGISVSTLNVESGNGDVKIKNLTNPDGKITIKGKFTDVEMEKNLYTNCAVSSRFGKIKTSLLEDSNASTILDLWCGNIDVNTAPPTTHYKLSLTTSVGSVFRNKKEVGKKLNSDGSGAARISSSIFLGDFHLLSALGEKEPAAPEISVPNPETDATIVPDVSSEQVSP